MYTEPHIYIKKLLFVDGPQQFSQNHQRQKRVFWLKFLFKPNLTKNKEMRKKQTKKPKKNIISNNPFLKVIKHYLLSFCRCLDTLGYNPPKVLS
jgi:hypothetical protein